MARRKKTIFNAKRSPLSNTTLARQVAKQNLTTLNHALWVTEHSHAIVKSSFGKIPMPSGAGAHGCQRLQPGCDRHTLVTPTAPLPLRKQDKPPGEKLRTREHVDVPKDLARQLQPPKPLPFHSPLTH